MDILQNLTNMLGQSLSGGAMNQQSSAQAPQGGIGGLGGLGGLGELLNPAVLGSLAGALFPSGKTGAGSGAIAPGGGGLGGALGGILGGLLGGGGGMGGLGGLLGEQDSQARSASPDYQRQYSAPAPANPQEKATRLIRALVYAAKADGHIDDGEQRALNAQIDKLNLGPQARDLLRQCMNEPLDPNRIAQGVTDGQEALQLYALSCAVTGMDQFMERSYLDGLAQALRIPAQAKAAIDAKFQ